MAPLRPEQEVPHWNRRTFHGNLQLFFLEDSTAIVISTLHGYNSELPSWSSCHFEDYSTATLKMGEIQHLLRDGYTS